MFSNETVTVGFIYECDDANEHNCATSFLFMIATRAFALLNVTTRDDFIHKCDDSGFYL